MWYTVVERFSIMPMYTGLKDFVNGCQKLLKLHGNIPVFIRVAGEDTVAPFGIAIQQSSLLGGDAIVFKAGPMRSPELFDKGECTE